MSVILNSPHQSKTLDRVKIANIEVEYNPAQGRCWVIFWLVLGYNDTEGNFVQHVHPETGSVEYRQLKIENGINPFDNSALGACDTCGKQHPRISGECDADGCAGTVKPYDGWNRLTQLNGIFEAIRATSYEFLLAESALGPDGEPLRLLDAVPEE